LATLLHIVPAWLWHLAKGLIEGEQLPAARSGSSCQLLLAHVH
jgi:hypothetical protein